MRTHAKGGHATNTLEAAETRIVDKFCEFLKTAALAVGFKDRCDAHAVATRKLITDLTAEPKPAVDAGPAAEAKGK